MDIWKLLKSPKKNTKISSLHQKVVTVFTINIIQKGLSFLCCFTKYSSFVHVLTIIFLYRKHREHWKYFIVKHLLCLRSVLWDKYTVIYVTCLRVYNGSNMSANILVHVLQNIVLESRCKSNRGFCIIGVCHLMLDYIVK